MKYLYILLFLILSKLAGQTYFVHLTDSGLLYRNALLHDDARITRPEWVAELSAEGLGIHSLGKTASDDPSLSKWIILDAGPDKLNPDSIFVQLKKEGMIDYFEKPSVLRIHPFSSDSLFAQQWYLAKINIEQAWQQTQGDPSVVVGVIDTGIDYRHPDLKDAIWKNDLELNGLDGLDDDGNGFVDDSLGWDFTDAPRFADGGDYLDPDNDPMDEFGSGHGTQIAGIIAARSNNQIGISGIAPKVRIMNLRAGTSSGYLEEDDVARAILYALDKQVRIINMSFGDVALSRLLRDVIRYAYERGVIFVASAGNSASNERQFPSGLEETIAVSATTRDDNLAGFSSFGPDVDLAAPGADIVSTAIGGSYNSVNGTSFSAPMVSAVSALILSQQPQFTPEQVRSVLKSSAEDILFTGWDMFSGTGRLDAYRAVAADKSGTLELSSPVSGSSIAQDTLWLVGTSTHPDLDETGIAYGIGQNPTQWTELVNIRQGQVVADTFGYLNLTGLPDTLLTVRLRQSLLRGRFLERHYLVKIDRSPPQISDVNIVPLFDGTEVTQLISFSADEVVSAEIVLIPKQGGEEAVIVAGYEAQKHNIKIHRPGRSTAYQLYIKAQNSAGLVSVDDSLGHYYQVTFPEPFQWTNFAKLPWQLPAGYYLDHSVDLDQDGKKEIVFSRYDQDNNFGPVEVYEFDNNRFTRILQTTFVGIPRDAGDVDGDSRGDLLIGYGRKSWLLESSVPGGLPDHIVWSDTLNFWAASYTDLDGDGKGEITGRKDSVYLTLESGADNHFVEVAEFVNTTAGANQFGVPHVLQTDLNANGRKELVFGDSDGDVILYESTADNRYRKLSAFNASSLDATALLDYFSGISGEPAALNVVTHTSEDLNFEHEFAGRYWALDQVVWNKGRLARNEVLRFSGYQSLKNYDSGIKSAIFDDQPYLFIGLFPDLYVFRLEGNSLLPVWHKTGIRSNTVLVDDFDNDGKDEFYVSDGEHLLAFSGQSKEHPPVPYPVTIQAVDTNSIRLAWGGPSAADHFNIYRGREKEALSFLARSDSNTFTDSTPQRNVAYYYGVSTVDSAFTMMESPLSELVTGRISNRPGLVQAKVVNDRQLKLIFTEPVRFDAEGYFSTSLLKQKQKAVSAVHMSDRRFVLAGFSKPFLPDQIDTVFVRHVVDMDGLGISREKNKAEFRYQPRAREPYVRKVQVKSRQEIVLQFSAPMEAQSVLDNRNYELSPSGTVESVTALDEINSTIRLDLSASSQAGGYGRESYLVLKNIRDARGTPLTSGNQIHLNRTEENLEHVILYPQPVKPYHERLIFAKLPQHVVVQIYSLGGIHVATLDQQTDFGGVTWDLRDKNGKPVRSGVYIYRIEHSSGTKIGKFVIVR